MLALQLFTTNPGCLQLATLPCACTGLPTLHLVQAHDQPYVITNYCLPAPNRSRPQPGGPAPGPGGGGRLGWRSAVRGRGVGRAPAPGPGGAIRCVGALVSTHTGRPLLG
jgi:hypothetical protein